jgi:hypothetical protein
VRNVIQCGVVGFRNYQHMQGGLREKIMKGDEPVIFKSHASGNLFGGYFAEYTVHIGLLYQDRSFYAKFKNFQQVA